MAKRYFPRTYAILEKIDTSPNGIVQIDIHGHTQFALVKNGLIEVSYTPNSPIPWFRLTKHGKEILEIKRQNKASKELCLSCGEKPRVKNKTLCVDCNREYRQKAKQKAFLSGKCTSCLSKPAKDGFLLCESCLEYARAKGRKRAERVLTKQVEWPKCKCGNLVAVSPSNVYSQCSKCKSKAQAKSNKAKKDKMEKAKKMRW